MQILASNFIELYPSYLQMTNFMLVGFAVVLIALACLSFITSIVGFFFCQAEKLKSKAAATAAAAPAAAPAPAAEAKPAAPAPAGTQGSVSVDAPMPGTILDVKVSVGATVNSGDVLVILEAMKMENEIVAPQAGKVASINVSKGDSVDAGQVIVTID